MKKRILLTVALAAIACFAAEAAVTDLAGTPLTVNSLTAVNADGYTNSGDSVVTLTFAFDDDCTAPAIGGAIKFVKRGSGSVTFDAAKTYTGGTIVSNGYIVVSKACNVAGIGSDNGTSIVLAGGGLAFTEAGFTRTLDRSIVVSAGTIGTLYNNSTENRVNVRVDKVDFRNATLKLAGGGLFFNHRGPNNSTFQTSGLGSGGTYLIADSSLLDLTAGDTFGGANTQVDITLKLLEGAKVYVGGTHSPLTPKIIMEGGSHIYSSDLTKSNSKAVRLDAIMTTSNWKSLDITGRLTVVPGQSSNRAKITASDIHLASTSYDSVFDIQSGAVLEVNSQLWPAQGQTGRSLRKLGAGTLNLTRPLAIGGSLYVEEGTVELAPHVMLGDVSAVYVKDEAKLVLGDGSLWNHTMNPMQAGGFLSTADVWFDATAISAKDGEDVSSVPNLGMAGGLFGKFTTGTIPNPPSYDADGINGKPALYFAGGETGVASTDKPEALVLTTYTNKTDKLTFYIVYKQDGWENDSYHYYKWHGPLSFCNTTTTAEDYNTAGAANIQYSAKFTEMNMRVSPGTLAPGFDGTPTSANHLLVKAEISGTSYSAGTWWSDDNASFRTSSSTFSSAHSFDITRVCLGGRLTSYGAANYNRMLHGWIGELIAFSRVLTDDERAYVESYLKRKWFNSSVAKVDDPRADIARSMKVAVAADSTGTMGFVDERSGGVDANTQKISAVGPGTLEFVGSSTGFGMLSADGGTLRFGEGSAKSSEATLWLDPSDEDSVTTNDAGKVVSVANKGSIGGSFSQCLKSKVSNTPCPLPSLTNLNGLAALKFDCNSALAIDCDVSINQDGRAQFMVFGVFRRDGYVNEGGKGRWGAPFSFFQSTLAETLSDSATHSYGMHPEEFAADQVLVYGKASATLSYPIADGSPYLFNYYCLNRDWAFGYMTPLAENPSVMSNVVWSSYLASETASKAAVVCDFLVLGGRQTGGKCCQWYGKDSGSNRMWNGTIAELIVFDRQVAHGRIAELTAYLQKKWFNLGSGSATPPAWLKGATAGGPASQLSVASSATVEVSGAPVSVTSLSLADGATLTRTDAVANMKDFALFDVSGALSLAGSQTLNTIVDFPKATSVRVINANGVSCSSETWNLVGPRTRTAGVAARADGLWLLPPGTVMLFW